PDDASYTKKPSLQLWLDQVHFVGCQLTMHECIYYKEYGKKLPLEHRKLLPLNQITNKVSYEMHNLVVVVEDPNCTLFMRNHQYKTRIFYNIQSSNKAMLSYK